MIGGLDSKSLASLRESEEFRRAHQLIVEHHTVVADFPQPGIHFVELLGMLYHQPQALTNIIAVLGNWVVACEVDCIAVIDARGFVFGAPVAAALGMPLVTVRKQGKLPPPVRELSYSSEYAGAALAIQQGLDLSGKRVAILDDVLATGGTVLAAVQLLREAGASSISAGFVGEIAPLAGREKLEGVDTFVITSFFAEG